MVASIFDIDFIHLCLPDQSPIAGSHKVIDEYDSSYQPVSAKHWQMSGVRRSQIICILALTVAFVCPAVADSQHPGLHNVISFSESLINGSAPESDAAFDLLWKLGIKTIICVDGATPDAARTEARGMRYVHLPIGDDVIDETEGLKLIRAIRDLPKPIYIHCYHGVHGSVRMKLLNEAGWRTPADHPDIDPANESKILAEHFIALSTDPDAMAKPTEFQRFLSESREATRQLHEILLAGQSNITADTYYEVIEKTCMSCHVQFRN